MATNNAINIATPAASATTDTTSATNISTGTLAAARMVNAGVMTGDCTTTFPAVTVASIGGKAVTLANTLTTSGNFALTLTQTGTTTVTLPTSGTLATTAQLGALPYTDVTGTTQSAAVNNAYGTNNAGQVTVTLPTTAVVGQIVQVVGVGAGGWRLAQNASQLINFGSVVTTTGTGGRLDSTNRYDGVTVLCIIANTTWAVTAAVGNITYV